MVGGREGTRLQARIADTGRPLETDTRVNGLQMKFLRTECYLSAINFIP
jgi:hypothetical protein